MNQEQTIKKYPKLIAHMICESLGYFTPESAANALDHYRQNEPFACEWYSHMANIKSGSYWNRDSLIEIGKIVVGDSFRNRRFHKGYMNSYELARTIVEVVRRGQPGPVFASWF